MTKTKISPLIKAMAEWAVGDTLVDYDAGHPSRKRLPREYYKKKSAEEEPPKVKLRKSKAKPKRRRAVP